MSSSQSLRGCDSDSAAVPSEKSNDDSNDSVDSIDGNVIIVLVVYKSQLHKSLFVFSV
jgi:hypothetical protein